jgi:hypothetical protein
MSFVLQRVKARYSIDHRLIAQTALNQDNTGKNSPHASNVLYSSRCNSWKRSELRYCKPFIIVIIIIIINVKININLSSETIN